MKMSSRKTMLTAAVLVTLSTGTTYAATPGTVDTQDLFHANRLVTDSAKGATLEEQSAPDRYEASISAQKKEVATASAAAKAAPARTVQPARLRWESVDTRLAARNNDPSFSLSAQKAKPVIITAEDIKREEKLAAKEGRPVQELVGDVNMNRPVPPPRPKRSAEPQHPVDQAGTNASIPASAAAVSGANRQPFTQAEMYTPSAVGAPSRTSPAASMPQSHAQQYTPSGSAQTNTPYAPAGTRASAIEESSSALPQTSISAAAEAQQKPSRPRYPQLPHEEFSLTPPAENGAVPKQPDRFEVVGSSSTQHPVVAAVKDQTPVVEHSVRPEGVPAIQPRQVLQNSNEDLAGISDEVCRHILAGQLAMEVQLQRDPSVAGMRAITKVLRENTTLTRLQKIDFLIGFGRALHRSGLPRQQEALLIKTIAEAF